MKEKEGTEGQVKKKGRFVRMRGKLLVLVQYEFLLVAMGW